MGEAPPSMSWRGLVRSRCTSLRLLAGPAFRYRVAVSDDRIRSRSPGSFCLPESPPAWSPFPATSQVVRASDRPHKGLPELFWLLFFAHKMSTEGTRFGAPERGSCAQACA